MEKTEPTHTANTTTTFENRCSWCDDILYSETRQLCGKTFCYRQLETVRARESKKK